MPLYSDLRKAWSARVADYRESGLSMHEWCEKNQLPMYSLRYWVKKERLKTGVPTGWAPVEVVEDMGSSEISERTDNNSGCVTLWVGAARIEVRPGFDPAFLSDVLKAVVAVC